MFGLVSMGLALHRLAFSDDHDKIFVDIKVPDPTPQSPKPKT